MDAAAEEVYSAVMAVVTEYLAACDADVSAFKPSTPLGDAGLDSLDLLKLASLLSEAVGLALPSTVLFDYPSVDALCSYVVAAHGVAEVLQTAAGGGAASRRGSLLSPGAALAGAGGRRARSGSFGRAGLFAGVGVPPRARTGSFARLPGLGGSLGPLLLPVGSGATSPTSPALLRARAPPPSEAATGLAGDRRRRRTSVFSHGALSAIPLDGRRATILLDGPRGVPTLQVVVAEAAAQRLPAFATAFAAAGAPQHRPQPGVGGFEIDAPAPVPVSRWDVEWQAGHSRGHLPARFGSFVEGADAFDAGLFSISSAEAALMDPQQRLILECTYEALQGSTFADAGAAPALPSAAAKPAAKVRAPGKPPDAPDVGVFVGASYAEYLQLAVAVGGLSTYTASGGSLSVLAGRVSYLFGFRGPSTVTDTACSSSLVALGAAHSALLVSERVRSCAKLRGLARR